MHAAFSIMAQLWMGTHPSCPSRNLTTEEDLQKLVASDPERLLGPKVVAKFGNDLPFLFKVLAIGKALSIQAHPDKELAQRLHKERPDVYKGTRPGAWFARASFVPVTRTCGKTSRLTLPLTTCRWQPQGAPQICLSYSARR